MVRPPPIGPGIQVMADLRPAKVGGMLSLRFASAGTIMTNETAIASRSISPTADTN